MRFTKFIAIVALGLLVCLHSSTSIATPGTAFNYQGQLKIANVPYDGTARFEFSLWDAATLGHEFTPAVVINLDVVDGLFMATLDFGDTPFSGEPRWLEISVDTGRGPQVLDPRQPLTPAPYALTAMKARGVDGHSLDSSDGVLVDEVYVDTAGNVGVGTTAPRGKMDVLGTLVTDGLRMTGSPVAGHVLTSDALGNATWKALPAGGSTPWESNHDNDVYYMGGNVGIGTSTPAVALDVAGALSVDGFQMGGRTTAGHVLTTDVDGVGTWQPLPSVADPVWGQSGSDIYYDGQVGIGTSTPQHTLDIVGSGATILRVHNTAIANEWTAIHGECDSPDCRAIRGVATVSNGDPAGVYGQASSANGMGVYGRNLAGGYGVYGEGNTADGGWAGYFSGRGYFSGDVGIGTTSPQAKLHVNGTVRMNALQLGSSATSGYVLTTNASGIGTWQAPPTGGGVTLPIDETVDADSSSVILVTNTGSGPGTHGIRAIINAANTTEASAGSFRAYGAGSAIEATSDSGTTVYASGDGIAVYGTTSGTGGGSFRSSMAGGYGVRGRATNTAADTDSIGGWFESSGSTGKAVYAKATGATAIGLKVETTGAESYAIDASSPWYGLYASGGLRAARFYGAVDVKSRTTSQVVFAVGNNGITDVDVLHINGGSDLAEGFDIRHADNTQVQPGMVVCIDPENAGGLVVSRKSYDRRVAGVISGAGGIKPGMMMGQSDTLANGEHPVALSGRVYVWADAFNGPIEPGDLLTSSDTPGHAMKITNFDQSQGATLGKAMTSLKSGRGLVLVLVSLQ